MRAIKPSLSLRACACFLALFVLNVCAESGTSTAPDPLRSIQASASNVLYSVYPARTLLSSAAIVGGDLRTQRLDDGGNNVGLEKLWPTPDAAQFQWDGNRLALLTNAGVLYARDRISEWVAISSDVADFQLEGNRIAALQNDGRLRVKEGINGPWTDVTTGVTAFQLEGDRVAALHKDGLLRAKDGINAAWSPLATGVSQFQLEGNSIGIVQPKVKEEQHDGDEELEDEAGELGEQPARGTLLIKNGINGAWIEVARKVSRFQLEGSRIAYVYKGEGHKNESVDGTDDDPGGESHGHLTLIVQDGVNGAPTRLSSGVVAFQLEGNRIGVLLKQGSVRVKDGIHGAWVDLSNDAVAFQLQRSAIGVLSADGLRVRENINSGWKSLRGSFAGATQIRLLVDVPLVFRTTPPAYQFQANKCDAEFAEGKDDDGFYKCYPEYRFGVIVGKYGRFCGAGVPSDGNWDWAHGEGVIDPADGLCREHDHAGWYGIDPNNFRYHSCVVRYGYEHDRLTVDGVQVVEGTSAWDDAFALMPRTRDARTAWWQEASGPEACNADRLAEFTAATASGL